MSAKAHRCSAVLVRCCTCGAVLRKLSFRGPSAASARAARSCSLSFSLHTHGVSRRHTRSKWRVSRACSRKTGARPCVMFAGDDRMANRASLDAKLWQVARDVFSPKSPSPLRIMHGSFASRDARFAFLPSPAQEPLGRAPFSRLHTRETLHLLLEDLHKFLV